MDCSSLSLAFCDKPSEKTAHQENFQRLEQCSKKTVDFSYTTILCRWSQICKMCSYLVLDTQCQQHHSVSIIFYESYLSQALQVSYNIAQRSSHCPGFHIVKALRGLLLTSKAHICLHICLAKTTSQIQFLFSPAIADDARVMKRCQAENPDIHYRKRLQNLSYA